MVDYPGEISLKQIYGTYTRAVLKVVPNLRPYTEPLTDAMVDFYLASQRRFTTDIQAHYVYSPRELTRWVRGIYEAIRPLEILTVEGLVRVWAHEALRLFQDRLVAEEEKLWTDENIDATAMTHFPTINKDECTCAADLVLQLDFEVLHTCRSRSSPRVYEAAPPCLLRGRT
jgi:dynein heavy chain 1